MKAYFETVPADLDKSALVDGCNRFQAYYKVVLPVSGPGLVAGGAFTFMLCWNEFVVAQVLNTKPGTTTLPPVIAAMNTAGLKYHQIDYVPCYRSEAGTGNAMCFAYWQ